MIPNPNFPYPIKSYKELCFLKSIISSPNIIVGDYTYFDAGHDSIDSKDFEKNVLYHNPNAIDKDKLIIGKFCSIASGVKFFMNAGNHDPDLISTYPFKTFDGGWEKGDLGTVNKGDTIIGNEVWIGFEAVIMSGVRIDDGAVIGARAVVTKNVPAYEIWGGNPAKKIRDRFKNKKMAKALLKIQWWNWDDEKIFRNQDIICGADIKKLRECV